MNEVEILGKKAESSVQKAKAVVNKVKLIANYNTQLTEMASAVGNLYYSTYYNSVYYKFFTTENKITPLKEFKDRITDLHQKIDKIVTVNLTGDNSDVHNYYQQEAKKYVVKAATTCFEPVKQLLNQFNEACSPFSSKNGLLTAAAQTCANLASKFENLLNSCITIFPEKYGSDQVIDSLFNSSDDFPAIANVTDMVVIAGSNSSEAEV